MDSSYFLSYKRFSMQIILLFVRVNPKKGEGTDLFINIIKEPLHHFSMMQRLINVS